jgi:hypothetical protein
MWIPSAERCTVATKYKYYVNTKAQSNGDNEVHKDGCGWMPSKENQKYLGEFESCEGAVKEAKKTYPNTANGCYYCSNACHTT